MGTYCTFSSFFFFLSVVMLNYFLQVIWNYINDKSSIQTFYMYIELSSKSVGVG